MTAEVITLTSDFRDGFIRGLKTVTKEEARIGATSAYRKDNDTTVFENGEFTPCKACKEDPDASPAWRVRAEKITEVKSEGNIYFENATFEVFGVPTLWVPYFYMPDPSVARRSGFLMPVYDASTNLGYLVGTPYYFALSASYDLTVTPEFTTKAGEILRAEWRQRLQNGSYKVDFAGAYNANPTADVPDNAKLRGSIKTTGEFAFDQYWKWGWDATLESDKTFRRYYGIDGILATDRISKLYLEGQRDRNYFSAQLYEFGSLTPDYTQTTSPGDSRVLPVIDYNYVFGQPILGGELSFDANAFSLTRNTGTNLNQVVGEAGWRRTVIDPLGQAITPFAHARADLYDFSNYQQDATTVIAKDGTIGRGSVAAGVDYRYPFIKHMEDASLIFEPIGQIIYRPDLGNQSVIPNEDAQSLVFDDTLLFDINKFSGYDRIETGTGPMWASRRRSTPIPAGRPGWWRERASRSRAKIRFRSPAACTIRARITSRASTSIFLNTSGSWRRPGSTRRASKSTGKTCRWPVPTVRSQRRSAMFTQRIRCCPASPMTGAKSSAPPHCRSTTSGRCTATCASTSATSNSSPIRWA